MSRDVNKSVLLLGLAAFGLATPSLASSARELGQSELRQIARAGTSVSLKDALTSVSRSLQASVLDVRAFDADGLYYRVVLKDRLGHLLGVVIDAQTGRELAANSPLRREIMAAAK